MLMSMMWAPRSRFILAASAITSGSQPASWMASGCSSSPLIDMRSVLRAARIIALPAIISETTRPTPQRLTRRRNGKSVTPAMGARITGSLRRREPICRVMMPIY